MCIDCQVREVKVVVLSRDLPMIKGSRPLDDGGLHWKMKISLR